MEDCLQIKGSKPKYKVGDVLVTNEGQFIVVESIEVKLTYEADILVANYIYLSMYNEQWQEWQLQAAS